MLVNDREESEKDLQQLLEFLEKVRRFPVLGYTSGKKMDEADNVSPAFAAILKATVRAFLQAFKVSLSALSSLYLALQGSVSAIGFRAPS
ncbi:hypothetical protein CU097_005847 [Rhizopus azygosporus]|uniref:Uncharacterized protein n=1 Tax=Rhizopus azygosporus TaxID=86630 RepID=A0A367J6Z2_RHIAZ|nr:hypothetical protein CU097_005847 [Rhizopus azygosporus]